MLGAATALLGFLLKGSNLVTGYLERRQDAEAAKYKARVGAAEKLGSEALRVEAARQEAWGKVTIKAMAHPMWWVAWALFVIPVGLYDGMIYFVSTFDAWLNVPGCLIPAHGGHVYDPALVCEWFVTKVPPDQGASRTNIIYFIFGSQAASGAAAGIAQALSNWLRKGS